MRASSKCCTLADKILIVRVTLIIVLKIRITHIEHSYKVTIPVQVFLCQPLELLVDFLAAVFWWKPEPKTKQYFLSSEDGKK